MTSENQPIQIAQYTLAITLLDDMHTGSSLGNSQIDSFQARDKSGNPVITRQHLKGLLKAAADEWLELRKSDPDHPDTNKDECQKDCLLEEAKGGKDGIHLIMGDAFYTATDAKNSPFIVWGSSARGKDGNPLNRAPKDDSLRSVEYVRAGSQFEAEVTLFSPQAKAESYQTLFEKWIHRIDRIGAKRNRGAGGITLTLDKKILENPHIDAKPSASDSHSIILHFTNQASLRLPSTQSPGNIIPTATTVSSSQLRGALANLARLTSNQPLFNQLIDLNDTGGITIGQACPVPEKGLYSTPWPHSVQLSKAGAQQTTATDQLPWWFNGVNRKVQDTLNQTEDSQKKDKNAGIQYKRNKSASYIYWADGKGSLQKGLYAHNQSKGIQMRNKVRTAFLKEKDNSELFSEEILPEKSHFSSKISFQSPEQKASVMALLTLAEEQKIPFTLGRGKAPCVIEGITEIANKDPLPNNEVSAEKTFTLVLTSDWLIYNPKTLQPYESLNVDALEQALSLKLPTEQGDEKRELSAEEREFLNQCTRTVSETTRLTGFNFASGLPKRPLDIIAAGSVMQFRINPSAATNHKALIDLLIERINSGTAVGDRTRQGLGQYWCYTGELNILEAPSQTGSLQTLIQEQCLDEIKTLVGSCSYSGSKSQWYGLLTRISQHKKYGGVKDVQAVLKRYKNSTTSAMTKFRKTHTDQLLSALIQKAESSDSMISSHPFEFSEMLINYLITNRLQGPDHSSETDNSKQAEGSAQ